VIDGLLRLGTGTMRAADGNRTRGPMPITEGTLLAVDEASMLPGPDLADLITLAKTRGGKLILAGDTSQLQAVQSGGGISLLAERLGYARLAEPVRFREPWEQVGSLRLREGDITVLAEYDQHAALPGGDLEQVMDGCCGRLRRQASPVPKPGDPRRRPR
jgi:AAA domain